MAQAAPATQPQTQLDWSRALESLFAGNSLAQWLSLLALIFLGVVCGRILQTALRTIATRSRARGWHARHHLFTGIAGPANLFAIAVGLSIGMKLMTLTRDVSDLSRRSTGMIYIFCLAWAAYNLAAVIAYTLERIAARAEAGLQNPVVPLIRKTLRIFVVVIFALFAARNVFGADISTWLAGLGIAGLAVSLAAQESIKNLFGSVTILMDRPFALGDRIRFGSNEGLVEEIGFRSTKVRTIEGFLITVPNSKIVDDAVTKVTPDADLRRQVDITITYDTPPAKIREAVEIVRQLLGDPSIAPQLQESPKDPLVSFSDLNSASLNIRVVYWFRGTAMRDFLAHCDTFNQRLVELYNAAGIEFAFPTQTVYLANDDKRQLAVRQLGAPGAGEA